MSVAVSPLTLSPLFALNVLDVPLDLLGSTEPRLWTRPLVELTRETSYGFAVVDFARDVLCEPLDPWEAWLVVHLGELLPDGRPRFRQVLVLVARQNGKTHVCRVLTLFWLYVECWPLTLATSTNLDYAKESWESVVATAEGNDVLAALTPKNGIRRANGEQCLSTVDRCRHKIAASNRKGGRSLSIDRLVMDELREHQSWEAWNAAVPATNARPYAQIVCITNSGDDKSVVLNALRDSALGETDRRLGLFEWSAPDGSDPTDPMAWVAANPNLGRRLDVDTIAGPAARAKAAGGEELAGFLTEQLCMRVRSMDSAVDPGAWTKAAAIGSLDAVRGRVALCLDISPDGLHATLCAAAAVLPGVTRVEVVAAWSGVGCSQQLRADLPDWIARVKPRSLGWFPSGPAAALAADLSKTKRKGWPPPGVTIDEIRTEQASVCMGFAEQVIAGRVLHSDDALLTSHVTGSSKLRTGDRWVFSRKGEGHCDAAYAAAGAVHIARTLPAPRSTRSVVSSEVAAERAKLAR